MNSLCIKINDDNVLNYLIDEIKTSSVPGIVYRKHEFKIYKNIILHYKGTDIDSFYRYISSLLADTIILFFEEKLVKDLIELNYFYFSEHDKKVILDEYKLIIKKDNIKPSTTMMKKMISSSVYDYISHNKTLLLTGFVNFRLKEYIETLEDLVSEAVNQYIIDKEYLKFVDLLSNYVDSKIPNNLTLNLVYINAEGFLLTENGEFVELEELNSSYLSDISFSKNDYILNTLVGLLPSKIMVHLISPKDQFIKTIELIFENKVEFCEGCELCRAYELLNLH